MTPGAAFLCRACSFHTCAAGSGNPLTPVQCFLQVYLAHWNATPVAVKILLSADRLSDTDLELPENIMNKLLEVCAAAVAAAAAAACTAISFATFVAAAAVGCWQRRLSAAAAPAAPSFLLPYLLLPPQLLLQQQPRQQ